MVHPGADEYCDGVDEDCDGAKDQDAVDATVWYLDRDGDGYGDDAEAQLACEAPLASVAVGGDCDDHDPDFNPGAPEPDCTDPTDWNCDGQTEYADEDGDGWIACLECDDLDGSVNPDALERCDGVDDDCDGFVDEEGALDPSTWYWDGDGDGFGDAQTVTWSCSPAAGYLEDGTDCDDSEPTTFPGAVEVPCDGIDNDCDSGDIRCRLSGAYQVEDAPVILYGPAAGDLFGGRSAMGGDTDGDGVPELLIGAAGRDDRRGAVYLVQDPSPGAWGVESLAIEFGGSAPGDTVASSTADFDFVGGLMAGDYDQVAVSADTLSSVFLFAGPLTASVTLEDADLVVSAGADPLELGTSVGGADLDGDGQGDLLVTDAYTTTGGDGYSFYYQGAAWGFYGPLSVDRSTDDADFELWHHGKYGWFGYSSCIGDLDGDGQDDAIVGAPCQGYNCDGWLDDGVVYAFRGPLHGELWANGADGETLQDADARWSGGTSDDSEAGYSLDCGGDVDGDGRADLLIGAPFRDGAAGIAALVDGSLVGTETLADASWSVQGNAAGQYLGVSIGSRSDVDGDGCADVVVSYFDDSDLNGASALFYGGSLGGMVDAGTANASFAGESYRDQAVFGASGADLDQDGFDDLIIGAPYEDTVAANAGAAYLYYGGGWVP